MVNRDKSDALANRQKNSTVQAASLIARMLAVSGFSVDARDYGYGYGQSLTILSAKDARSLLTIRPNGYARWEYEPCTGPASNPVAVTSLILYVLDATGNRQQDSGDYSRFLLKGAVGRQLRDRGLNVSLCMDENLESLEVSAEIEITNPARPARGMVRANDLADIEWHIAYHEDFPADIAMIVDTIIPVLRDGIALPLGPTDGHHARQAAEPTA